MCHTCPKLSLETEGGAICLCNKQKILWCLLSSKGKPLSEMEMTNSCGFRVAHGYGMGQRGPTWTCTRETHTCMGTGTNPHWLTCRFSATPRVPDSSTRVYLILVSSPNLALRACSCTIQEGCHSALECQL